MYFGLFQMLWKIGLGITNLVITSEGSLVKSVFFENKKEYSDLHPLENVCYRLLFILLFSAFLKSVGKQAG